MKVFQTIALLSCLSVATAQQNNKDYYTEKYRPQVHFTPEKNWTNDPNGLVYLDGEYHLFYQHNPFGNTWGHMSWGHAVSKDLVSWQHLPVAIPEEGNTMIFSGSCVVDKENSSGFAIKKGQVPMVAIYTAHINMDAVKKDSTLQNQHIAYSLDNGRTWTKYKSNPVLDLKRKDFRDPKVFWYAKEKKWVMAVVFPEEHIVQFYSSPDLKQWKHMSDFGPAGDSNGIWECPDLLQVPVTGNLGEYKWVLINSVASTTQYFVGEFDGTKFHSENAPGQILRPDYGPDYYAPITFNNLPQGHPPVLIGWATNWAYAGNIPTSPWRSAMSLPRELSVTKTNDGWRLISKPVGSLQKYRGPVVSLEKMNLNGEKSLPILNQVVEIEMMLKPGKHDSCGIKLAVGNGKYFTIGYTKNSEQFYVDRSNSGDTSFSPNLRSWLLTTVPLKLKDEKLKLHIFFDKSIVEVYANDGEMVITQQLFPEETSNGISLFSKNGNSVFEEVKVWPLKSAWR